MFANVLYFHFYTYKKHIIRIEFFKRFTLFIHALKRVFYGLDNSTFLQLLAVRTLILFSQNRSHINQSAKCTGLKSAFVYTKALS